MAKQTLNLGAIANDGTGSNLRAGGTIINANFTELYTALGDGTTITLTATPTELNLLAGATAIVTTTNAVTLTNKTVNLTSNTLTGTTAQFNTALSDGDFATLANTVTLTNKTISGASNTLSNIGNSSLTNSSFSIRDDSSSAISIALGGTLKLKSNDGITTTVSQGDTITISLDSNILTETSTDTLTNKSISLATNTITGTIAQFNTAVSDADFATLAGTETLTNKTISGSSNTLSNIANGSLTNSSITLGSTSTSLGATTSSVAGLSLTGSANTIDLTSSGNKLRFNFANSGSLPAAATYAGMFATTTGTAKAFFSDSGSWNEIASENSSINLFSDVDLTTQAPADQQGLVWVSSSGKFVPGTGDLIKTAALIDVTPSGSAAYLFNSHYSGNNPTLYFRPGQTYAFRLDVTASHPFHLQTVSGAYSSGNAYSTGLTHVSLTGAVTTGASALLKVSGILYYEVPSNTNTTIYYVCQNHSGMAGKIVIGNITQTSTGDGSTTTVTINSGRNVNDLLVFVNGICLEPTSDYTISGTTLTFVAAPVSAATITIRYL
jgi:hypothetical protein